MSRVNTRALGSVPMRLWSALLAMLLCAPSLGQDRDSPARSAGQKRSVVKRGQSEPIIDGHGWVAMPSAETGSTLLMHLPPRAASGVGESGSDTQDGVIRTAIEIPERVDGVAWWRETPSM